MQWAWDGINFKMIHPQPLTKLKKNNASCVLQISTSSNVNNSVLLTGDIEAKAEHIIARNESLDIKSSILIAPHHGSKTSSTPLFINKVNPKYVMYPTGYRNRYHFPAEIVSKRYQRLGVMEYATSDYGAITFTLQASKIKKPELYRVSHRRFWHN